MARNRRERGENPDNILGELGRNEASESSFSGLTTSDIADAGYGSGIGHDDPFAKLGRGKEKIHQTQIESISPNLTQPRRAIPSSVRQYWSGSSDLESMATFFKRWLEEINLERQNMGVVESFPLDDYLEGRETVRTSGIEKENDLEQINSNQIGAKEKSLMPVVELAASIKRDGLINPISIAQKDLLWEIETGERRWLAYHLLNWRLGGDEWQKIPSRQVDGVSIWRQATENNARADLNAIGKARQFALLLMDVRAEKSDDAFADFNSFEHEQDYYAQVSDGENYRIPRSRGEDILNAMGLENPVQLRQYRALLRLPQPVWEWADDLNWTESFIRKEIFAKAENNSEEDVLRLGVKNAKAEGYTVSSVTAWEHLLENSPSTKSSKTNKFTYKNFSDGIGEKVYNFIQKMPKKDKERAIDYLEEMLATLKSE